MYWSNGQPAGPQVDKVNGRFGSSLVREGLFSLGSIRSLAHGVGDKAEAGVKP